MDDLCRSCIIAAAFPHIPKDGASKSLGSLQPHLFPIELWRYLNEQELLSVFLSQIDTSKAQWS